MKQKRWGVLLSVAFVALVFCAVRDLRRPRASAGAQRPAAPAVRAPSDEVPETIVAAQVETTNDLQLRHLETARDAQRIEQQEAAQELQQR